MPQLLKPARLEPVFRNKRSHRNEEATATTESPRAAKNKIKKKKQTNRQNFKGSPSRWFTAGHLVRSSTRLSTPDEPPVTQTKLHFTPGSSSVLHGMRTACSRLASVDVLAPIRRSQPCRGNPGFRITTRTLPVKGGKRKAHLRCSPVIHTDNKMLIK